MATDSKDKHTWFVTSDHVPTTLCSHVYRVLPVRPDLLLGSLAAYDQALPYITAFRICHTFGKGPDVHVTKLPVEMRTAIEKIIIDAQNTEVMRGGCGAAWKDHFTCFENRCEPRIHVHWFDDRLLDWYDETWEMVDKCEDCADDGCSWGEACEECDAEHERCQNLAAQDMTQEENGQDWEGCHLADVSNWEKLVENITGDQTMEYRLQREDTGCRRPGPAGMYNRPLEVLRRHFGLDIEFKTSLKTENCKWTRDAEHEWHQDFMTPFQTTVCFLTLHGSHSPESVSISTATAQETAPQDEGTTSIPDSISRRFHRALKLLRLKPILHPSQTAVVRSIAINADGSKYYTNLGPASQWEWPRLLHKANASWQTLFFDLANMEKAVKPVKPTRTKRSKGQRAKGTAAK